MHWWPIRGAPSTDLGVGNFCSGEITFILGPLSREGKVARHKWEGGVASKQKGRLGQEPGGESSAGPSAAPGSAPLRGRRRAVEGARGMRRTT